MAKRRKRRPAHRDRPPRAVEDRGPVRIAMTRPGSVQPSPADSAMRKVSRLVAQREFGSMAQVQACVNTLLGDLPETAPTTPAERAQDMVYAAWEGPAAAVAEGLESAGDVAGALGVLREATAAAGQERERAALEQVARLCLRHPDHEAEGLRACARLAEITGERSDAVIRRLAPPWRRR